MRVSAFVNRRAVTPELAIQSNYQPDGELAVWNWDVAVCGSPVPSPPPATVYSSLVPRYRRLSSRINRASLRSPFPNLRAKNQFTPSSRSIPSMKSASLLLATVVTAISPFVAADGHQWAYTESNTTIAGPSHWNTYYPACGGSRQSPIDISTKACGRFDEAPLSFSGECPNFELSQTPEAFKGAVNGGSCTVKLDELTYNLLQFHVHLPSEHTLNGNTFDGEAHFVHNRTDGGELLVIGVFLEASDDAATNDFFSDVLYAMDTVDKAKPAEVSLSAYSNVILSTASGSHLFNYPGSLTTPGCNEIVDWWVVQKPLKIATSDLERLQKYFQRFEIYDEGKDARSVQPLNGRTITTYKV